MNQLNASEAIYGFAAWLTTRKEVVKIGSNQDAAPVAKLCKEYCEANKLDPVTDEYPNNLNQPKE